MTTITADWLAAPGTQSVLGMLTEAGHQAFAVGGCVRNALLDVPVSDIDIATDAEPGRVMDLAVAAGLKAVPTGIDHGTVTLVTGGDGYEVTTFRADVETDGRRAVVRYSRDVAEDARRRDFTMNALYADATGRIVDPLGGLPDLQARRVRFIEDPVQRIREDYLRILRFFRFSAWYGDPAAGMDAEALAAIASHLDGLAGLSRERVGAEVIKLMSAPDPAPAVAAMDKTGVLARILRGANPTALAPLVHLEAAQGLAPDPLRRLAAIGAWDGAALRLSRAQQTRLTGLKAALEAARSPAETGYRHGAGMAVDALLIGAATMGLPVDPAQIRAAGHGAQQICPVTARDLMPGYQGPALGKRLAEIEARWIASGFALDRAALLDGE